MICGQLESWLFQGTNTLLEFSAQHLGISVWVLTQKYTSTTAFFLEQAILDVFAGELSQEESKYLISQLEGHKFTHLVFSVRHPFSVQLKKNGSRKFITIVEQWLRKKSFGMDALLVVRLGPPEIPPICEQLVVLLSTGKAKEAVGMQQTHEKMKRLTERG